MFVISILNVPSGNRTNKSTKPQVIKLEYIFFSSSSYPFRVLDIILATLFLSSSAWNKSNDVTLTNLGYSSTKIFALLPHFSFFQFFLRSISWSILYHWLFLMVYLIYSSFRAFNVFNELFLFSHIFQYLLISK